MGENKSQSVVELFLSQIRDISINQREELDLSDREIFALASDISLRTELIDQIFSYSNDPSFPSTVIYILRSLCIDSRESCSELEANIKTIDVYGQRVSAGAAIGGSAALLYGPVALGTIPFVGPVMLAACGLIGLGYCVKGRMVLSQVKRELESDCLKMEDLIQQLENAAEKGNE